MTRSVPLFPLSTVLFPGGPLVLRIFEQRYLRMVRDCLRNDVPFAVALITQGSEVGAARTQAIGTLASVVDWDGDAQGLLTIRARGGQRFRRHLVRQEHDGLYVAEVSELPPGRSAPLDPADHELVAALRSIMSATGDRYAGFAPDYHDAAWVSYRLAELLPLPAATKQALLEMDDPGERLDVLRPALANARRRGLD